MKYSTELFKLIHLYKAKSVIIIAEGERLEMGFVETYHDKKYKITPTYYEGK